jgi:aminobenzoyl-glutamate utilization protein B
MNAGVSFMREHLIQEARVHHIISKGGEAPNNVPPLAENYYFIRAPRITQVEQIWDWVVDIAKGAALMTQTRMNFDILTTIYERLPNRTLARMGDGIIKLIGPPHSRRKIRSSAEG